VIYLTLKVIYTAGLGEEKGAKYSVGASFGSGEMRSVECRILRNEGRRDGGRHFA
jgi:hypothetical protein